MQCEFLDKYVSNLPEDVGVVMVHAVNPHGFAHGNRVDMSYFDEKQGVYHRVDPNRNFVDFTNPPSNPGYKGLHGAIIPHNWFSYECYTSTLKLLTLLALDKVTGGRKFFYTPAVQGQYEFPNGFSFGGQQPAWTNKLIHRVVEELIGPFRNEITHVATIDLHTGLGAKGNMDIYPDSLEGTESAKRLERWIDGVESVVQCRYETNGSAMGEYLQREFSDKSAVCCTIECGTKSDLASFQALRAQNWLDNYGGENNSHTKQIKEQLREAFYPETDLAWQEDITRRTMNVFTAVLKGLQSQKLYKDNSFNSSRLFAPVEMEPRKVEEPEKRLTI